LETSYQQIKVAADFQKLAMALKSAREHYNVIKMNRIGFPELFTEQQIH
jgi:hypothetical protein